MNRRAWAVGAACIAAGVIGALTMGAITGTSSQYSGSFPAEGCRPSPVQALIGLRAISYMEGETLSGRVFLYNAQDPPTEIELKEDRTEVYGVSRPAYYKYVGDLTRDPAASLTIPGRSVTAPQLAGWGLAGPPGIYLAKWSSGSICGFQAFEVRR